MKNPLKSQLITSLILFAATLFCVLLSPEPALAGTSKYTDGKFNFCVSVRFNASEAALQRIRQGFPVTNEVLAGVTDRQHGFGSINIINDNGAAQASRMQDVEVRLDHYLFRDRRGDEAASFVILRGDGTVRVLRYSQEQRVIIAEYQGVLPEKDVSRLLAKTRTNTFRRALRQGRVGGRGSDGNFFFLSVKPRGGSVGGAVFEAPKIMRDLIEEMRGLWTRMKKVPLADAYVRSSEAISRKELKKLRQSYSSASINNLPSDLQTVLVAAIRCPNEFQVLSRKQYEQLRAQRSLLIYNGSGYQISLYPSSSTTKEQLL